MNTGIKPRPKNDKPETTRHVAGPSARQDSETLPSSSSGLPFSRPPSHPSAGRQDSGKDGPVNPTLAGRAHSGATASVFHGLPYAWQSEQRATYQKGDQASRLRANAPRANASNLERIECTSRFTRTIFAFDPYSYTYSYTHISPQNPCMKERMPPESRRKRHMHSHSARVAVASTALKLPPCH